MWVSSESWVNQNDGHFTQSIRGYPHDSAITIFKKRLSCKIQGLSRSRRWDDAITRYQEAIKLDGTNQKAFHNLGFALNRVGRFDDAEEILTKGIELGIEIPTHKTNFLLERAFARAQLKKYLEALEDINQVIQIFPDSTKALYLRARIHLYRGASLDARSDAQDVLRLIPDHNGALRLLDQLS